MVLDPVDHADVLNPILREKATRSMFGVPLLVRGETIGVAYSPVGAPNSILVQFDEAPGSFAEAYADQNDHDHQDYLAFQRAELRAGSPLRPVSR